MIQISEQQLNLLSETSFQRYLLRLTGLMRDHFPSTVSEGSQDTVPSKVRDLVGRGSQFGLSNEIDLFMYVSLGFCFGSNFDANPALPWLSKTLKSKVLGSPSERVERAYELSLAATSGSGRPWIALSKT